MTAPPKPWELAGNRVFEGNPTLSSSNINQYLTMHPPPMPTRPIRTAPPLPSRGSRFSSLRPAGFGSYPGTFGSSFSAYSTYGGGYGSYPSYGMGQYSYPRGYNVESRFIQMAEEGSRPAFQSIESIVQAFCSVSFMMESTFNAMYSSFRAVLGVAENFGQLRSLFGQFLSVFTVFRWFRWLIKKGLYLLGLQATNPGFPSPEGGAAGSDKPFSWPVVFFLAIVFSGPYLMWKLLNSLNIPSVDPMNIVDWFRSRQPVFAATVLFDFTAASDQELTVGAGQRILIAPKDVQPRGIGGWLLAAKGKKVGLVPANYVQVIGQVASPGKTVEQKQPPQNYCSIPTQTSVPKQNDESQGLPKQGGVEKHIPVSSDDCKIVEVTSDDSASKCD